MKSLINTFPIVLSCSAIVFVWPRLVFTPCNLVVGWGGGGGGANSFLLVGGWVGGGIVLKFS